MSTVSRMRSHETSSAGQDEVKLRPSMTRLIIPACCLPHFETTAITGWTGSTHSNSPVPQHAPLCEQLQALPRSSQQRLRDAKCERGCSILSTVRQDLNLGTAAAAYPEYDCFIAVIPLDVITRFYHFILLDVIPPETSIAPATCNTGFFFATATPSST